MFCSLEEIEDGKVSRLGVWRIAERGPERIPVAGGDFEAHLESWIEADPTLLEAGLRTVGRQVVTFEAYDPGAGEQVLVRQRTETETPEAESRKWRAQSVEAFMTGAEASGVGAPFRALLEAGARNGLLLRPWKRSVMVTPLCNRARMLYTVRSYPTKGGQILIWVAPDAFTEFFPSVTLVKVIGELGEGDRRALVPDDVETSVSGLDRLFTRIRNSREQPEEDQED